MENIYILMLVALIILAVIDLVVGVSNDAVNFLNAAVGSKSIHYRTILIVASLGVFLGAATSSGMMEIARSGIFVPSQFSFNEVMYIFLAVMIADILLLDVFNSLGLPTSTTVSIVFELLGASVVMALIKISNDNIQTINALSSYINSAKALEIIVGILMSVVIAFTVGSLVMYISRLIFTFQYKVTNKYSFALFGGIAITSITYFIVIKGIKGSDYYQQIKYFIEGNHIEILLISFAFWTILGFALIKFFRFNILKLVIALGTFSLALAFAGNDLVNFIGVPITALDSYNLWKTSGVSAQEFMMSGLAQGVKTQNLLLFLAGFIMVITLWFSKKAKHVTETEINLSHQESRVEKFQANDVSRLIVRTAVGLNNIFEKLIPQNIRRAIDRRFTKPVIELPLQKKHEIPAFDEIRASVNLVISAILISMATSLKLPLSTTYVTFMVAMGSSLADRAWGLESAVFRVAGVFNVISGWFVTAISAFILAGIFTYLMYLGHGVAVVILLLLVFVLMLKNYLKFQRHYKSIKLQQSKEVIEQRNIAHVFNETAEHISEIIKRVNKLYVNVFTDLSHHDLNKLKKNKKHVDILENEVNTLRNDIIYYIKSLDENSVQASKFYIYIIRYIQDISQSINFISTASFQHVNNNHNKLKKYQIAELNLVVKELNSFLKETEDVFKTKNFHNFDVLIQQTHNHIINIEKLIENQVFKIRSEENSSKNTTLYFGILLETKDLLDAMLKLFDVFLRFKTNYN